MTKLSIIAVFIGSLMVLGQAASASPFYGARGENNYDRHVFYDVVKGEKTTEHSYYENNMENKK